MSESTQEASVTDILKNSAYKEIRRLNVEVTENTIIIRGSVPIYFLRQIALTSVLKAMWGSPTPHIHAIQ